jgi:hypothetical protein
MRHLQLCPYYSCNFVAQSFGVLFKLYAYNFFIITNLIHKFLVHSHKLHKIKFLYMFRAQSAHYQEVNDANCTYAASGIVTLCK